MKWDDVAIGDLRRYPGLCDAVVNLTDRINFLKRESVSLKGAALDRVPVSGGGSRIEDKILNNLVEREKKEALLAANKQLKEGIERGLAALDKDEIKVLEGLFMYFSPGAVERLARSIPCDRATVYRIRQRALYKFTVHMYGFTDF